MTSKIRSRQSKIELTPQTEWPKWAQKFWNDLVPLKDRVANHCCFGELAEGKLSLERLSRGLVGFYPLVENFPKFMSLNLLKTTGESAPGHYEAKHWLTENIKVEQNHADWWCDWAEGFGCTREELAHARPSPLMDAINHYLWHINTYGSLVEGIGATNVAVEWATGEWTRYVIEGVRKYAERGQVNVDDRTLRWLNAHAEYDDKHPHEAMALIRLCAHTPEEQQKAYIATKRGLEYYRLALDDCYEPMTSWV